MHSHIFREYDIRGIVHEDLLLSDVYRFGCAFARYCKEKNPQARTIALGRDGRIHAEAIKKELCRALLDNGFDVFFIGICPTPVVYFAMHTESFDAGIMITASHNGPEYNGFKLCFGKESCTGIDIKTLYHYFVTDLPQPPAPSGTYHEYPLIEKYCLWLAQHFSDLKNIPLNMVIDCGNGATSTVIPDLIRHMGWHNAQILFEKLDGTFPHRSPDPTKQDSLLHLKNKIHQADIGIAFDGDGDRMVIMTPDGQIILGDKALLLMSKPLIEQHPGAGIVFDVKCSNIVPAVLQKAGAQPIMAPTGHSFIKQYMKQHNALCGGELSCHFFFRDRYFGYDDGIYAMLRILELLQTTRRSLTDLLSELPTTYVTPELRIHCHEHTKQTMITHLKEYFMHKKDTQLNTMDGILVTMPQGRGIIRASHTQAVMCIRCESNSQEGLDFMIQEFYHALTPHFSRSELSQHFKSFSKEYTCA